MDIQNSGMFLSPLTEAPFTPVMIVSNPSNPAQTSPETEEGHPTPGEMEDATATAAADSGPTGRLWRAVIIESGISANNNYYSPEVLRASMALAENCPIRIYFFDGRSPSLPNQDWNDHMPQLVRRQVGGRVVANTVGFFNNVRFEQIQSTRSGGMVWALTGDAHITDPRLQQNLLNTWKAGGMDPNSRRSVYELSIEAMGPSSSGIINGKKVNIVGSISRYEEVSIVSEAAAGGLFNLLVASATAEDDGDKILQEEPQEPQEPHEDENDEEDEDMKKKVKEATESTEATSDDLPALLGDSSQRKLIEESLTESLTELYESFLPILGEEESTRATVWVESVAVEAALKLCVPAQPTREEAPESAKNALGIGIGDPPSYHSPLAEGGSGSSGSIGIDLSMVPSSQEYLASPALSRDPDFAPIKQAIFQACQFLRAGDLESAVMVMEKILQNKEEESDPDQKPSESVSKSEADQTSFKTSKQTSKQASVKESISNSNHQTGAKRMSFRQSTAERYGSNVNFDKDESGHGGYVTSEDFGQFRNEIKEAISGIGKFFRESNLAAQSSLESVQALRESSQLSECKAFLNASLAESGLHEKAQQVIRKKFDNGEIFSYVDLKESIADARTLISTALAESNVNRYPSNGRAPVASNIQFGKNRMDYEKARLDLICGYDPRKDWNNLNESQRDTYRHAAKTPPSIARWFEGWYDDSVHNLGREMGRNALYLEAQSQPYVEGFLSEAVSTDLPALLGDSQTRALMQAFKTQAPMWRNISDVVPVANFKTQRRILLGGLGKLPVVVQGDSLSSYTYTNMGFPADEERTYGVKTRGGLVVVTRQMIIDDDLQGIQAYPKKIGEAAVSQLNELIFKALQGASGGTINGDLSYDGAAIYRPGTNYTTSALAYSSLVNAIQNLSEVRQFANVDITAAALSDTTTGTIVCTSTKFAGALNVGDDLRIDSEEFKFVSASGTTLTVTRGANGTTAATHLDASRLEQLGPPIAPDNLWVVHPNALRSTVKELLASALRPDGGNNGINALFDDYQEQRILPLPVHSMYLSGDKKSWWLAVNKPIEVGFLGGKEDPQLFLQDNPLFGPVFNGDQITWKVRHEYGYVLKDHRMVSAGIVP